MHRFFRFAIALLLAGSVATPVAAQEGSPGPEAAAEPQIVFDVTLEAAPDGPVFVGMARLTFPPGSWILGGTVAGARIFLVESGRFQVEADDAGRILRRGDPAAEEALPAGSEGTLAAGDLLIVWGNPPFTVTNLEEKPATLLDIVLWPSISEQVRPFVTVAGVIFEPLAIGTVAEAPRAPVRLTVQRRTIAPGEAAGYELGEGPMLVYIESGTLGITASTGKVEYSSAAANAPGTTAGRPRTLGEGDEARMTAGGAITIQAGSASTIRNLGRTRLELLELVLEPAA
jgi:hypothetical protein